LAKEDCASWALEQGPDLKGIWAGRSERQRRRDKRAGVAAAGAPASTEAAGGAKRGDEASTPRSEALHPQAIVGRLGVHAPVVARELALLPPRKAKAPKVAEHLGLSDPGADDLAVLLDAANRWLAG
jgi:hypothetical protein